MISCISLQELQQKVSYADSYEKNRRFWLDSFTEVLEHCIADNSVLPDVDCPLFAKQLMNMLLNLYLEGGTRQEMDAFGWAFLQRIATSPGYRMASTEKSRTPDIFTSKIRQSDLPKTKEERQRLKRCLSLFTFY